MANGPYVAPTVSVVIATYDRPEYLRQAIGSALNGAYEDIEIIVSDDHPDGANRSVTESFADDRLRHIPNGLPRGIAGNHLNGFLHARGEFIAILNDDDRWKHDFLERCVPPLQEFGQVSICFCDHNIIDAEGHVLWSETEANTRRWTRDTLTAGLHQPFVELAILDGAIPACMAAVFRKSALGLDAFPLEVGPAYDRWIAYDLSRDGNAAYFIPDRLTDYRVHRQMQTAASDPSWPEGGAFVLEHALASGVLPERKTDLVRKLGRAHYAAGMAHLRQGSIRHARHLLTSALAKGVPRSAAAIGLSLLPRRIREEVLQRARSAQQ